MNRILIITLAWVLATAISASGHHNWLTIIPPESCGDAALLVASFGHRLPLGDAPPKLEDFEELALLTPDGERRAVSRLMPLGIPSVATFDVTNPGVWGAASWREHYGCKTTEGYRRGRRAEVEAEGFKVLECKHTFRYGKTYLPMGSKGGPGILRVGHILEIVPDGPLPPMNVGDTLWVTVFFEGRPEAGITVSGACEGKSEELAHPEEKDKFLFSDVTDDTGRVPLVLSESGLWFWIAEKVFENPEPGVDKLYYSATLTLRVGPE